MKALMRRAVPIIALLLILLPLTACAQQVSSASMPDFNAAECREFRRRLLNHTLLSAHDRAHSTNLGIAGASLFWTGLPAVSLGISALVLGRRQSTPAVRELLLSGVTKENVEEINRLCAILVKEPAIVDASVDGRNRTAIILGSFATALGTFVFVMQIFFGLFTYWKLNANGEDDLDTILSDVESVIKRRLTTCSGDDKSDGVRSVGDQDRDLNGLNVEPNP